MVTEPPRPRRESVDAVEVTADLILAGEVVPPPRALMCARRSKAVGAAAAQKVRPGKEKLETKIDVGMEVGLETRCIARAVAQGGSRARARPREESHDRELGRGLCRGLAGLGIIRTSIRPDREYQQESVPVVMATMMGGIEQRESEAAVTMPGLLARSAQRGTGMVGVAAVAMAVRGVGTWSTRWKHAGGGARAHRLLRLLRSPRQNCPRNLCLSRRLRAEKWEGARRKS